MATAVTGAHTVNIEVPAMSQGGAKHTGSGVEAGAVNGARASVKAVEVRLASPIVTTHRDGSAPSPLAQHSVTGANGSAKSWLKGQSNPASRSFRAPGPARRIPSFRQVATPNLAQALRVAERVTHSPKPAAPSPRVRTRMPGVQAYGHHARRQADEAAFAAVYRDATVDQSHSHPPPVDGATPTSRAAMRRASRRLMVGPESELGVGPATPRSTLGTGPVPVMEPKHSWRMPVHEDASPHHPPFDLRDRGAVHHAPSIRVPAPPRVASLAKPGAPGKRRSLKARKAAYTQRRLKASAQLRKDCEFLRTRAAIPESDDGSGSHASVASRRSSAERVPRVPDGAGDTLAQPQPRSWEEGGDTLRMSVVHDYVHRSLEKPDVASSALWRFKVCVSRAPLPFHWLYLSPTPVC